jgi:hypothetical protein
VDVNLSRGTFGDTALIGASCTGHTKTVIELLKHDNIDVNFYNNEEMETQRL